MLLPQEQSQLPHIHPSVWSNSSKLNPDPLLAEALRPFSAPNLACVATFPVKTLLLPSLAWEADIYNVFIGGGDLTNIVFRVFFSVSWEKMGGNHCMYPVKFELKSSWEGSSSQM